MLHGSIPVLGDVLRFKKRTFACREDVQTPKGTKMSNTLKTPEQLAALEALEQAYEYYSPAEYVPVKAEDEPVEYYEYAAAA